MTWEQEREYGVTKPRQGPSPPLKGRIGKTNGQRRILKRVFCGQLCDFLRYRLGMWSEITLQAPIV